MDTTDTEGIKAVAKGSSASIYPSTRAEVDGYAPRQVAEATSGGEKPSVDGCQQSETDSAASSASSNISTPLAVASSSAQVEGTSYLDAQSRGHAHPLLNRLDMNLNAEQSPTAFSLDSPPMTPARRRLIELDSDATSRSPGSRSVHIALTSPSTARTPLAATAPLPETPLKHGHEPSVGSTPTRSSILQRRRAPAIPPLSPPSHGDSQDKAPRGLGLGLTPTKQISSAFFGGQLSPAVSKFDTRTPSTPSRLTKSLDFDVTSTTEDDDSLSLASQDIESSMLPSSSQLTSKGEAPIAPRSLQHDAKHAKASDELDSILDRVRIAQHRCVKTARGSGASRWADPKPENADLEKSEGNHSGMSSTLLSRKSSPPEMKKAEMDKREAPTSEAVSSPARREGGKKRNGKKAAPLQEQKETKMSSRLATTSAAPISPSSSASAATPVMQSVDSFGGQSARGLTSQVQGKSSAVEHGAQSATATAADPFAAPPTAGMFAKEERSLPAPTSSRASLESSDPFSGGTNNSLPSSSPIAHLDWAEEVEDNDELPDLDGWGLALPQSSSSPALREIGSFPQIGSSIAPSVSAPTLPPNQAGKSNQQRSGKPKNTGRTKKVEHLGEIPLPARGNQSSLGGIRIAGIASSGVISSPSSRRHVTAPQRKGPLLTGGASEGCNVGPDSSSGSAMRGRGASGPGGGAWLHDMVQGPPPPRRHERPRPQLSDNGAFARLARGIVGVRSNRVATAERTTPAVPERSPQNAPTGPAAITTEKASGGGREGGSGRRGKAKGHRSPRRPNVAKSSAKEEKQS